MKKLLPIFFTTFLSTQFCKAQIYIEPIIGYQNGLNNSGHFSQINSAIQFSFIPTRKGRQPFSLQFQKSWPLAYHASDSAFSLNPSLPLYSMASKTIKASNYSFSLSKHIKITGNESKGIFNMVLGLGVTHQHISVDYQYDKTNYTLLNPDQTQNVTNFFLSGGIEYIKNLKKGRLFTQVVFSTRGGKNKYPGSFGFMAPLSINIGYSILIKKKKK